MSDPDKLKAALEAHGQYEIIRRAAEEIEQDLSRGEIKVMEVWGKKLDRFLKLIESLHHKAEDLPEWPGFKHLLVQRRVKNMLENAQKRNQLAHDEADQKSLKELILNVNKNFDESIIDSDTNASRAKCFTMTRNNREDAPINSFLAYYAFKAEERKFYIRYPN